MVTKIGINGFGRMGRLALRASWDWPDFEFVHINEMNGGPVVAAHLLAFDSVHGRWSRPVEAQEGQISVDGKAVRFTDEDALANVPWKESRVDIVLECSGKFRSVASLAPYFTAGVAKVIVAAPVKDGALNVVMGINDDLYRPNEHHLLTAASCTTNCLAPVVKVVHEGLGIRHGVITTIHDITNTQTVVDAPHKDLRRARASSLSLIPTTTGSATAISLIYPELNGKLSGLAVRVPLLNASLTDCVFEVTRPTTVAEINGMLRAAAEGPLKGILGYEERPLVSVDFKDDPRSAIIDAPSTMVVDGTCVKILAWYDNEIGYVNRMMELTRKVARSSIEPQALTALRNYALVTSAYWAFTLTDGALRMLVLLHFHELGYTPVQLAFLFLFYEFFGVVTNLVGGWIAARMGLKITLLGGLALQIVALAMLSAVSPSWSSATSVAYVMAGQSLSGIAKDLTKMSAKSTIKLIVPENSDSVLFKWVAVLTGSKNALKGVGFFVGGLLLTVLGFKRSLWVMAGALLLVLLGSVLSLPADMGKAKTKRKFKGLLSKSREINLLSAARFFLFGSRDIWFVVGVPVFLSASLGWNFNEVGGFLATWVIGYGIVQSVAPSLISRWTKGRAPEARAAQVLALLLAAATAVIAASIAVGRSPAIVMLGGLGLFGLIFALNSSVHSYLILAYSDGDQVALNVGFYYMANAAGRLVGTLLSGVVYQVAGVAGCLWASAAFAALAGLMSMTLPRSGRERLPTDMTGDAAGAD